MKATPSCPLMTRDVLDKRGKDNYLHTYINSGYSRLREHAYFDPMLEEMDKESKGVVVDLDT
jgi:hypothetical protein